MANNYTYKYTYTVHEPAGVANAQDYHQLASRKWTPIILTVTLVNESPTTFAQETSNNIHVHVHVIPTLCIKQREKT